MCVTDRVVRMSSSMSKVVAGPRTLETPTNMFINGKFVPSSSGFRYETFNPATEEASCHAHSRSLIQWGSSIFISEALRRR